MQVNKCHLKVRKNTLERRRDVSRVKRRVRDR